MKKLSQHIQETVYDKPLKKAFKEKLVDEDLSDIMRTSPAKGGGIMRGTISNKKQEEK